MICFHFCAFVSVPTKTFDLIKLRTTVHFIPKTLDDNEQFDNADTLCAELEPLLPADYTVQVLEPSREYPEPAIFIGLETDINDYTFGEMERNNRR